MIKIVPFMTSPDRTDVYLVTDGLYQSTREKAAVGIARWILLDGDVDAGWSEVVSRRFREFVRGIGKERDEAGEERPAVPGALLALALAHPPQ